MTSAEQVAAKPGMARRRVGGTMVNPSRPGQRCAATSARRNERFEAFQHAISQTFVPLALCVDDVGTFRGQVRSASLGTVRVSDVRVGSDVLVRRTAKLISHSAPDYLKVAMPLNGKCVVTQDGHEETLAPRDFAVYDTTRPYSLAFSGVYRALVVMFPRDQMRLSSAELTRLTARRLNGRDGLGASVSAFLTEMGNRLDDANTAGTLYLADAVLDMLAASFAAQLSDETGGNVARGTRGLALRIRAFIESRLGDPGLDVSTIAAAHHVSVRYLQKLFESQGQTVTGWIRDRRIEHCRRDLEDHRLAEVPVSSIAARWGLVNASHFSRLFKAVHGSSPAEYRAQVSLRSPSASTDRG
nr:helix-turn-helix domain-containing protein [Mycobacterium marinum]